MEDVLKPISEEDTVHTLSMLMRSDWHGIVKILDIVHVGADGVVVWRDGDLYNILHREGEAYMLNCAFTRDYTSDSLFFGLDGRATLSATDTMSTVASGGGEPSSSGYARQQVDTISFVSDTYVPDQGFNLAALASGHMQVKAPIITFSASTGSWGPVSNLFLTTASDNTGVLIASVALSQSVTLSAGESISLRMGISLLDCP